MTVQEFDALFLQCPTYQERMVDQIEEYRVFEERIYAAAEALEERLDEEGVNLLTSLLELLQLSAEMRARYYFA